MAKARRTARKSRPRRTSRSRARSRRATASKATSLVAEGMDALRSATHKVAETLKDLAPGI